MMTPVLVATHPIVSAVFGLVAATIGWAVINFAMMTLRARRFDASDGSKIPVVPYWIPFLGSAIAYSMDTKGFLEKCRQRHGDVFILYLAGKRIVNVCDIDLWRAALRERSMNEAVNPTFAKVSEDMFKVSKAWAMGSFTDRDHIAGIRHDLFAREPLWDITERAQRALFGELDTLSENPDRHLWNFASRALTRMTIAALHGTRAADNLSPPGDDTFFQKIIEYDHGLSAISKKIPAVFSKERRTSMRLLHELTDMMCSSLHHNPPSDASACMVNMTARVTAKIDKDLATDWDVRVGNLLIVWVAITNSVGVLFQALFHVFSDPELLGRVQREVETVRASKGTTVTSALSPDCDGKGNTVFTLEGFEQMPVITAVIHEATRLASLGIGARHTAVGEPTIIKAKCTLARHEGEARTLTLPPDTLVFSHGRITHFDSARFPDANMFQWDRFYGSRASDTAQMTPFGGGLHMCPGRSFVFGEVRSLIANLVARYDARLIDTIKPKLRDQDLHGIALSPETDCRIHFSKRL